MGAAWPTALYIANYIFAFFFFIIYVILQCNISELYVDAILCISMSNTVLGFSWWWWMIGGGEEVEFLHIILLWSIKSSDKCLPKDVEYI